MKKNIIVFSNNLSLLLLIGITILGIFFRIENLSLFNVYPDSYQSLIGALNITNYHNVLGYLGQNGIVYPYFFSWTHPGYPLLIDAITAITHRMTESARGISFAAGVLTIPLAYLFIKRVFSSNTYGFAGALFVAFSFNLTVWSGFIMTETTGVFFMMLFLLNVFTASETEAAWFNWRDIVSGILFFYSVMTRYEYIILLLPLFFLFFLTYKQALKRIVTFISVFILSCALLLVILFPLPSTFTVIIPQLQAVLMKGGIIVLVFLLIVAARYLLPKTAKDYIIRYGNFAVFFLIMISLIILRNYFIHEILLTTFSVIGFYLMLTKAPTRIYGYFSLTACACLLLIYYSINPEMERYVTHVIPFLIIPASYAFIKICEIILLKNKLEKGIFYGIISLLVVFQAFLTFSGLKYSQDASWFRPSYEDKSASLVKKYISNNNYLLITSYPEPYYYILRLSTQSIADEFPYVFIDNVKQNQQILIIEDMGMHDDFPHFTNFLDKNMIKNKIATFWVHEKFHYVATVQEEKYPVIIYKTSLADLELKIRAQKH